jgi:chaperonin GroES
MALNIKPLSESSNRTCCCRDKNCFRDFYSAKENHKKGTVVAVGNGTKEHTMTVKIGDSVLYGKYAGTELKLKEKII